MYFELVGNSTEIWSRLFRLSILYCILKTEPAAVLEGIDNFTILILKSVFKYWDVNFGRNLLLTRGGYSDRKISDRDRNVRHYMQLQQLRLLLGRNWSKAEPDSHKVSVTCGCPRLRLSRCFTSCRFSNHGMYSTEQVKFSH